MFGLFGSSAPAVPNYTEIPTPTSDAEYVAAADKAKTTILDLLTTADGWNKIDSPVAGVELMTKVIEGSPANISRAEGVLDIPLDRLITEVSSTDGERFKAQEDDLLDWKVLKTISDTQAIVYSGHKVPFPVTNRELCYLRTIHKLEDGRVLICGNSINDKDVAAVDGRVRAVVLACWLFAPQSATQTHVTRLIQLDPKGSVPAFLINAHQAKSALAINILKKAASA